MDKTFCLCFLGNSAYVSHGLDSWRVCAADRARPASGRSLALLSEGMASGVARHLLLALLGRRVWHDAVDAVDVFQIAVEIAAGGQQQTRVLLERLFIGVEGLVKRIKLRVLAIGFSVDAGRFGIGLADGLLGFAIRLRAYAVQLALLLATNLGAGAIAFRAVTRRNPPALGNHAFVDPLLDLTHIVDALDTYIDELDAQIGHVLPRLLDHQRGQGIAPQARLWGHVLHHGRRRGI